MREARELVNFVRGMMDEVEGVKLVVNLIPFNDICHPSYIRPLRVSFLEFQRVLIDNGMFVFIRMSRGDDDSAACCQLATNKNREWEQTWWIFIELKLSCDRHMTHVVLHHDWISQSCRACSRRFLYLDVQRRVPPTKCPSLLLCTSTPWGRQWFLHWSHCWLVLATSLGRGQPIPFLV